MKNTKLLIFVLSFAVSVAALADDNCSTTSKAETVEETREIKTDVPKHLVGATICVKQADGRESCVPAEQFKVVPRKQQFLVTKTKQENKLVCGPDKNRVSLLAGNGPKEGLDRSKTATTVTVESRVGAVGGLQYQRLITEDISVGAQVQTNESVLLNIGLDF
jgi:hypothetical protein